MMRELDQSSTEAAQQAALDYGNIFVGEAVNWTPPSGGAKGARVSGAEAKNRQENRIRWDIMGSEFAKPIYYRWKGQLRTFDDGAHHVSPFNIARPRDKVAIVDPRSHLAQFPIVRGRKGKRLAWYGPRAWTTKQALKAEYRRRLKDVGKLAAGWMAGVILSKRRSGIPAWVKRHGAGGGDARLHNKREAWYIGIKNSVGYHSRHMTDTVRELLGGEVKKKIRKRDEKVKAYILRRVRKARG